MTSSRSHWATAVLNLTSWRAGYRSGFGWMLVGLLLRSPRFRVLRKALFLAVASLLSTSLRSMWESEEAAARAYPPGGTWALRLRWERREERAAGSGGAGRRAGGRRGGGGGVTAGGAGGGGGAGAGSMAGVRSVGGGAVVRSWWGTRGGWIMRWSGLGAVEGRCMRIATFLAGQLKGTKPSGRGCTGILDTTSPFSRTNRVKVVRVQGPRQTPTSTLGTCLGVEPFLLASARRFRADMETFQQLPKGTGGRAGFFFKTTSLGVSGWLRELMLSFIIAATAFWQCRAKRLGSS